MRRGSTFAKGYEMQPMRRPGIHVLAALVIAWSLLDFTGPLVAADGGRFDPGTPQPPPELNVPVAPPGYLPTEPAPPEVPPEEPAPPSEPPEEPVVTEPAPVDVPDEPAPSIEPAPVETQPAQETPVTPAGTIEMTPEPTEVATETPVTLRALAAEPDEGASPSPSPSPSPSLDPMQNLVATCYALDTDGDSYVTPIEVFSGIYFGVFNPSTDPFLFIVLVTGGCNGLIEPVVTMDLCVFLDTNRNGVVTEAEIRAKINQGQLFPESDAKLIALLRGGACDSILTPVDPGTPPVADLSLDICLVLDANGDDLVDAGEAQALDVDLNGDGVIDGTDLTMAMQGCAVMLGGGDPDGTPEPPPDVPAALCAAIDQDADGVVTALEIAFAANDGVLDPTLVPAVMAGGCAGYLNRPEPSPSPTPNPTPGRTPTPTPGPGASPTPGPNPAPSPTPDPGTGGGSIEPGPGATPVDEPAAGGTESPALGARTGAVVTALPSTGAGPADAGAPLWPLLVNASVMLVALGGIRRRRTRADAGRPQGPTKRG